MGQKMGQTNIVNGKKVCNKCKEGKEVKFFSKRRLKSGLLSYNSWCKECRSTEGKIKVRERLPEVNIPDLINEKWVSIECFDGYLISNFGRVKSLPKLNRLYESLVYPRIQKHGYYSIPLSLGNSKFKRISLHRLIATYFIPNPENKPCINHIDNNPLNNKIENLEWCTYQENTDHAVKCNRFELGEERYNHALTEDQVLEIFNSAMEQRPLANLYNVHQGTIAKIKTGQNWNYLTGKAYIKKTYARRNKRNQFA